MYCVCWSYIECTAQRERESEKKEEEEEGVYAGCIYSAFQITFGECGLPKFTNSPRQKARGCGEFRWDPPARKVSSFLSCDH